MRNKELTLRRLMELQGKLKQLKTGVNLGDHFQIRKLLTEIEELHQDITDIIEREN